MNKLIRLLIVSSILQQYLLYVSTLLPLPFKVSACQPFGLDPKRADVILERSLMQRRPVCMLYDDILSYKMWKETHLEKDVNCP